MVFSAALLALLAGCATEEDFRRADATACTGYGFTPGSDAFAACLQREDLARRYDRPAAGLYGWYGAGFYSGPLFGMW
jgi:hypothetical protein